MLPKVNNQLAFKLLKDVVKVQSFKSKYFDKPLKGLVTSEKTHNRIASIDNKELSTIEFFSDLNKQDIFWDIGANVGQISLRLLAMTEAKFVLFEPEPANYFTLLNNIYLNGFSDRVTFLQSPLNSSTSLTNLPFLLDDVGFSSAGRNFVSVSEKGQGLNFLSLSGDDLVNLIPSLSPTVIKLDVDGIELDIILGLEKVLKSQKVRKLLFEGDIHSDETDEILRTLDDWGYVLDERVSTISASKYLNHHLIRK